MRVCSRPAAWGSPGTGGGRQPQPAPPARCAQPTPRPAPAANADLPPRFLGLAPPSSAFSSPSAAGCSRGGSGAAGGVCLFPGTAAGHCRCPQPGGTPAPTSARCQHPQAAPLLHSCAPPTCGTARYFQCAPPAQPLARVTMPLVPASTSHCSSSSPRGAAPWPWPCGWPSCGRSAGCKGYMLAQGGGQTQPTAALPAPCHQGPRQRRRARPAAPGRQRRRRRPPPRAPAAPHRARHSRQSRRQSRRRRRRSRLRAQGRGGSSLTA